jgi:hypothetical protein
MYTRLHSYKNTIYRIRSKNTCTCNTLCRWKLNWSKQVNIDLVNNCNLSRRVLASSFVYRTRQFLPRFNKEGTAVAGTQKMYTVQGSLDLYAYRMTNSHNNMISTYVLIGRSDIFQFYLHNGKFCNSVLHLKTAAVTMHKNTII